MSRTSGFYVRCFICLCLGMGLWGCETVSDLTSRLGSGVKALGSNTRQMLGGASQRLGVVQGQVNDQVQEWTGTADPNLSTEVLPAPTTTRPPATPVIVPTTPAEDDSQPFALPIEDELVVGN